MTKFTFRLATLLKLREADRDARRVELAEAHRADDVLRAQRASLEDELRSIRAARAQPCGVLDVDLMIRASQHELILRAEADLLDKQSAEVQAEIARRREKVIEADREVKVLEKLRERQSRRFEEERLRRESKLNDEIGQRQATQRSIEQ